MRRRDRLRRPGVQPEEVELDRRPGLPGAGLQRRILLPVHGRKGPDGQKGELVVF